MFSSTDIVPPRILVDGSWGTLAPLATPRTTRPPRLSVAARRCNDFYWRRPKRAPSGSSGAPPQSDSLGTFDSAKLPNVADFRETVVFRWLAAGDRGDLDVFDDLLHPDVVIHAPVGLSTNSAEAEKRVWRDALSAMPDLRHEVHEVVVDGDVEMARVVVTGTMQAQFAGIAGSGRGFRIDQAVITHLRDGKVAEAWEIADIAALRGQVGDSG